MIKLSPALKSKISGKIEYTEPFNLENDQIVENAFFIATDTFIYVCIGDDIVRSFARKDCNQIQCEANVGCGKLIAVIDGEDVLLCRFTNKLLRRFDLVAKKLSNTSHAHTQPPPPYEEKKYDKLTSLKRIYSMCKPYILKLVLTGCLMVLASLLSVYYQEVQKNLIDNYLRPVNSSFAEAAPLFIIMITLIIATSLLVILKNVLSAMLGAKISDDLRQQVFNKVQSLSMSYITSVKPGVIINRITSDTNTIREFMEHAFAHMVSSLFNIVVAFGAMCAINWKLALITVICAPLYLVFFNFFRHKMHRLFRTQFRKGDKIKAKLQDVISGIRVVKVFGKEESENKAFTSLSSEYAKIQCENESFWAIFFPMITLIIGLGINVVYYFGGLEVLSGSMTVGTLIQFTSYATMLYTPMRWIARLPRFIVRMTTSVNRLYEILDESEDIVYTKATDNAITDGNIEFKNVCFGYETAKEVLKDISFKINSGEMIGLVGESGVGKSTITNLIMRLYDAQDGHLLIDGKDIKQYDKNALHAQIGTVLQETMLFAGTVLDNLKFVKRDATYSEIISACKLANAHDFIIQLPDGYNTYIGERGYNLSGGERQRIAIARALLCDPKILILDEATSSLDTQNEMLIQQALNNLCKDRTTVAIAHRLSTLRNADRIIVLDKGKVSEIGSHSELVKNKGIYYSLVTAQSKLHSVKK